MEKYHPMAMPNPNMPTPFVAPTAVNPAMMNPMVNPAMVNPAMVNPVYAAPVNVHASYEEVNIYPPKKHYPVYGVWTTTGAILVLYILLVIILRSTRHC